MIGAARHKRMFLSGQKSVFQRLGVLKIFPDIIRRNRTVVVTGQHSLDSVHDPQKLSLAFQIQIQISVFSEQARSSMYVRRGRIDMKSDSATGTEHHRHSRP